MSDIFRNDTPVVRTVRPDPRDVLDVAPGQIVTNIGARTVQYDEATDFASPTNRTTGQSVTTSVRTFFRVTAGQGKVSIVPASVEGDVDARLDALVAVDTGLTAATTAYNQTAYSTASHTVDAATVAAVATTAATQTTPFGYGSGAQADAIPVAINALAADVLSLKKVVTALIDDLQAKSIVT